MDAVVGRFGLQISNWMVSWVGLALVVSIVAGYFMFRRLGRRAGLSDDDISSLAFAMLIGGIAGAWAVRLGMNVERFTLDPAAITQYRVTELSLHGAILLGPLSAMLVARKRGIPFHRFADLPVPGLILGTILVQLASYVTFGALGRLAPRLPVAQHPVQLYGMLVGVLLLIMYLKSLDKAAVPGKAFWSFVLWYSLLRFVLEEPFQQGLLYLWGFVDESFGIGLFSANQMVALFTVPLSLTMLRLLQRVQLGSEAERSSGRNVS